MNGQAEPDNLISYLELHADEVRTYCELASDISSLAEQIVPSQESGRKLTQQLQEKLPTFHAHQVWLHDLLDHIEQQGALNQSSRLQQRPDQ